MSISMSFDPDQELPRAAFDIYGEVDIWMTDGRFITSKFPLAAWKWLRGKDWFSVTVYDPNTDQAQGWDRF